MKNKITIGHSIGSLSSIKIDGVLSSTKVGKVEVLHPLLRGIYDRGGTMEIICPKCPSKEIAFQVNMDVMLLPFKVTREHDNKTKIIYSIIAEDSHRKWGYLKNINCICIKCNHTWKIKKF